MNRKEFEDLLDIKETFIIDSLNSLDKEVIFTIFKSCLKNRTEISQLRECVILRIEREDLINKILKQKEYNILYLLNLFGYTVNYREKNFKRKIYGFYNFLMKNKDVINSNLKLNNITIEDMEGILGRFYGQNLWFVSEDKDGQ